LVQCRKQEGVQGRLHHHHHCEAHVDERGQRSPCEVQLGRVIGTHDFLLEFVSVLRQPNKQDQQDNLFAFVGALLHPKFDDEPVNNQQNCWNQQLCGGIGELCWIIPEVEGVAPHTQVLLAFRLMLIWLLKWWVPVDDGCFGVVVFVIYVWLLGQNICRIRVMISVIVLDSTSVKFIIFIINHRWWVLLLLLF